MAEDRVSQATSADGTEIGYFTTGTGPPLVLVHGALGDHTRWEALRPHLEPHFTVHAMDRRGRGASGDHPDYAVEREFEDVAAVIDAVAQTSGVKVDVVGSSAGATFAIAAAALTPNVRRLVLFEPPARPVLELLPAALLDQLDEFLAQDDRDALLQTAYRVLLRLSEDEIDVIRSQPSWPNRLAAAHTVPRELRIPPERLFDPNQASKVTVPALLLVGGDTPEPFRSSAQIVADALPNAHVTVLDGQGHAAELFAAERVAAEMLTFLQETPSEPD